LALETGWAIRNPREDWQAAVTQSRQWTAQGQYRAAERELLRSIRLAESFGPWDLRLAVSLHELATVQQSLGHFVEAEKLLRRGLAVCERAAPPDPRCATRVSISLASLYLDTGHYAKAGELLRRSASTLDDRADAADLARIYLHLATLAFQRSDYGEAEGFCRRSLAKLELSGAQNTADSAALVNNVAALRLRAGRPEAAIPLLERAITMFEAAGGPRHPYLIRPLLNLAAANSQLNRHADALTAGARGLAIATAALGGDHYATAESALQYAAALRRAGRKREAKQVEKPALETLARHEKSNFLGHTIDFQQALRAGSDR
jgi:tetratricopeptide (TPR) repeat protein